MRMNAAQKEQLGGRTSADEHYARPLPHDLGNQLRNFAIGKCTGAVGRERRERTVIIQEQSARASSPNSLEEGTAHVLMYRDRHSQPRFRARKPRRQAPDQAKAQNLCATVTGRSLARISRARAVEST